MGDVVDSMIQFPCHCGYQFQVTDDMAGSLIQCPQCKRLNDIPSLGELERLDADGAYKLDEPRAPANPEAMAERSEDFWRGRTDGGGQIDRRGPVKPRRPLPVESLAPGEEPVPKYDPITGELIREIDIKPDEAPEPAGVPLAKRAPAPPKTMVDGIDIPLPLETIVIPFRLLRPGNLLVMIFVLVAHVMGAAMMVAIGMYNLLLAPFWLLLHAMLISHYGNVIDETGPTSNPELPRPLRHLEWHDDTFGPFVRVMTALIVCYSPAALLLFSLSSKTVKVILPLSGALAMIGTILFPAAVLTATTSGTLVNLRPDRIVGTALKCGIEYLLAIITWVIGAAFCIAGTLVVNWFGFAVFGPNSTPPKYITAGMGYAMLITGIYLMHFFCWHMGTLYRRNHDRFPWIYQRHFGRRPSEQSKGFPVRRRRRGPDPMARPR